MNPTQREHPLESSSEANSVTPQVSKWTFFSNHGHTLILISKSPELTVREMAKRVGITERALLGILADLQRGGYLKVSKEGRRNKYLILEDQRFRHPIESEYPLSIVLNCFRTTGFPESA